MKQVPSSIRHLPDPDLLDPISSEDYEFALSVNKKYDIPLDELCAVIQYIRFLINYRLFSLDDGCFKNQAIYKKLVSGETEIREIHIITNDGPLIIHSDDPDEWVKKMIRNFHKLVKNDANHDKRFLCNIVLAKLLLYTAGFNLGNFQKRVLIGLMFYHFKIYKGNNIFSESEYKRRRAKGILIARSYKHYLSEIVKSRLKIYSKNHNVLDWARTLVNS